VVARQGLTNSRDRRALRNILIPIVTVIGLQFGALIEFAIVTERSSRGPAWASSDRFHQFPRPADIVAYLLVIVSLFIVINLVVDILYSALDPRVRMTESKGRAWRSLCLCRTHPPGRCRRVQRVVGDFCQSGRRIRAGAVAWSCSLHSSPR
jgi:hypothetical protein